MHPDSNITGNHTLINPLSFIATKLTILPDIIKLIEFTGLFARILLRIGRIVTVICKIFINFAISHPKPIINIP